MNRRIVLCIHFDSSGGFVYQNEPVRVAATIGCPSWWEPRAKILRDYVLPSLAAQAFQDFETVFFLRPEDGDRYQPVLQAALNFGTKIAFNRDQFIRETYACKQEILTLVHLDSDDMYSSQALQFVAETEPKKGQVCYFRDGYVLDLTDYRLREVRCQAPIGPLAFYSQDYTPESLTTEQSWKNYRKYWRFDGHHYQFPRCFKIVEFPAGNYLMTIHGNNVGSTWTNPHAAQRWGDWITNEQKKLEILKRFAVSL